jgi:hypothetical protein
LSLSPITRARVWRKFLVYDLEWVPAQFTKDGSMPVRLCGVYDRERGYRCYRTVDSFLDHELTSKNRGKWFYAHAGGLADFQFLLQRLIARRGYHVEASVSGSSLIIVHVRRGKNQWHFVDSYWLLRDKLRNIGKWVGLSKGNDDESPEFYRDATQEQLREYNEVDCIILYKAIEAFEEALWELGGMLKMTQASCAMELFRRRFLKRPIETSSLGNLIARDAYFASRVEVFQRECYDAWYYDVNSSFPHAMTFPIPGEMTAHTHGRMPGDYDQAPFIADCEVTVPDQAHPPLATRIGPRLFFPTGTWRGWFSSVDLQLLEETGGTVQKVRESVTFEPRDDLADFSRTLYELRARSTGFLNIACKYMMNSVYGKFGEGQSKSGIVIDPPEPGGPEDGWEMLFPGCFVVTKTVPIPHEHVPAAVHITAIGRRTLWHGMSQSSEVHYCDTDGFSSADYLGPGVDGVLGEFKLEKRIHHGRFLNPKVYYLDGDELQKDGTWKALGDKGVRAKGFSRMTVARFETLADGGELDYRRMVRTKELLKSGRTQPAEQLYHKRLLGTTLTKRFFYPDGHSRPWTVGELRDILGEGPLAA